MKGKKDLTTDNNQNNILNFVIKQNIDKIGTVKIVEVVEVYDDSVDIKPCVNFLDGDLNTIEPNTVFNIPFFTYQCGTKAVKIKPEINDWGVALICDSNINKIKNSKVRSNPDNLRKFNLADSVYLGSFIKKQVPTEFIDITSEGITINSTSKISINALECDINCNTVIQGNLVVSGTATASDCISGEISGKTHTHGGVASGTSTTTQPQ